MSLIERHAMTRTRAWLDTFPIVIVEGARQVGKSTLSGMLASERASATYTLDDPTTLRAAREDPQAFVDQLPDGLLLIDEVQRAPELILPIKASVDRNRRPGRFLLTGSSDLLRLDRVPDSLAGRAVSVPLRGLSQGEIRGRHDDFVDWYINNDQNPWSVVSPTAREAYIQLLEEGSYPEAFRLPLRARRSWFDAYVQRITQRDTTDLDKALDPGRLQAVLRLIAANQSGELVKARVARDAELPETTLTRYLDALETLFLVEPIRPWTPNLTSREVGRRKVAIPDSGLAMRLARVAGESLLPLVGSNYLGLLLEGLVVSELSKQRTWSEQDFEIYHYRDRTGTEVDVILELDDGRIIGLEVKSARDARPDHFAGLKRLAERLGERFLGGIVLNTGERGASFGERLWSLPISSLWTVENR